VIVAFSSRQELFDIENVIDLSAQKLIPLTTFFYANLLVLLVNLWPHTHHLATGPVQSDGKLLLTIPFWSEARVQESHLGWFLMRSARGSHTSTSETANPWFDKAAALYPDNPHVRNGLATRLLGEGKAAEARACFVELLKDETAKPLVRAVYMNNIAYADLLLDDPALLAEADRYSQEAMTWMANSAPVKGTRGAVLIQLGRLDEALPLLLAGYAQQAAWSRAESACWLAILNARKQNRSDAENYLAQARSLNPKCVLLARAERELKLVV
jgi:Flp pilus assembly protein TadD